MREQKGNNPAASINDLTNHTIYTKGIKASSWLTRLILTHAQMRCLPKTEFSNF